eukprot:CAMPEP_0202823064 /NCGR_PEP_ID=MMETSP1389-20130828/11507_1 /ASSEMBLY_ACC=CAM_ASM_000865 /TAXON_ID=302021 /ORGANISM="Rhodomonas sp., Strain CCMP768" /LENGTH=145 /DNA_ID=CAMNT_0049496047 /DNA_START=73 /DNA_END=507 /DNA_ORIENTATION=-
MELDPGVNACFPRVPHAGRPQGQVARPPAQGRPPAQAPPRREPPPPDALPAQAHRGRASPARALEQAGGAAAGARRATVRDGALDHHPNDAQRLPRVPHVCGPQGQVAQLPAGARPEGSKGRGAEEPVRRRREEEDRSRRASEER